MSSKSSKIAGRRNSRRRQPDEASTSRRNTVAPKRLEPVERIGRSHPQNRPLYRPEIGNVHTYKNLVYCPNAHVRAMTTEFVNGTVALSVRAQPGDRSFGLNLVSETIRKFQNSPLFGTHAD